MEEERGEFDSEPPTVEEYESFFARMLKKAHRVIYVSLTSSMSVDNARACEAARNFENVTVVNSGVLSSSTGLLVMIACKLASQNEPADQIISELERVREAIHCNFVIRETKYMYSRGYISSRLRMLLEALNMRPSLSVKNDHYGVGHIYIGAVRNCYEKYIHRALPKHANPDLDLLFVTYVGLQEEELEFIGNEIRKRFDFKHIIFQKASAAISLNCGPGTFGLLYMDKTSKEYHLSTMLPRPKEKNSEPDGYTYGRDESIPERHMENGGYEFPDSDDRTADADSADINRSEWEGNGISTTDSYVNGNKVSERDVDRNHISEHETTTNNDGDNKSGPKLYDDLEGIDIKTAVKNSGSEEAFLAVLRIFYDMIPENSAAINMYYDKENWSDYTIKVHALKSSAKLIGALGLSEDAQALEDAGKAQDIAYIKENHKLMMHEYLKYDDILAPMFRSQSEENSKPVADREIMDSVYEAFKAAAEAMNCDMIEGALREISDYEIPEEDTELFNSLKNCADMFDYDGILRILADKGI